MSDEVQILPGLLGELSPTWVLQSQFFSRGTHLDFSLLPPTYLHMVFKNPLLLRFPLLWQKWACHHKCLHYLDKDLHSAIRDQEDAACLHMPLRTILLIIKLICPPCSSSSSSHRLPLSLRHNFSHSSWVQEH